MFIYVFLTSALINEASALVFTTNGGYGLTLADDRLAIPNDGIRTEKSELRREMNSFDTKSMKINCCRRTFLSVRVAHLRVAQRGPRELQRRLVMRVTWRRKTKQKRSPHSARMQCNSVNKKAAKKKTIAPRRGKYAHSAVGKIADASTAWIAGMQFTHTIMTSTLR